MVAVRQRTVLIAIGGAAVASSVTEVAGGRAASAADR
jgi:hypothetical protein